MDNLPQSTKAPELDDRNARAVLKADIEWTGVDLTKGKGVTMNEMGIYLAYLVGIGFLNHPDGEIKRALPDLKIDTKEKLALVGGRGTKV